MYRVSIVATVQNWVIKITGLFTAEKVSRCNIRIF